MHQAVEDDEEVTPGNQVLAVHAQTEFRVGATADEELVDSLLGRKFFEGLFGVDNGKRYEDGAGPGGDFVDIEIEPVGKENDLGRDGGNGVVVVFAESAEIHLGEGVARDDAAVGKNPLAALDHAGIGRGETHDFCGGVALDGEGDIAGAAGIDGPAAIGVLVAHDFCEGALEAAWIAAFEECVEEDVVGLEHGIGFEFAGPVAFRMLFGEEEVTRADDGRIDIRHVGIQTPKPGRRGESLGLLAHAISNASVPVQTTRIGMDRGSISRPDSEFSGLMGRSWERASGQERAQRRQRRQWPAQSPAAGRTGRSQA